MKKMKIERNQKKDKPAVVMLESIEPEAVLNFYHFDRLHKLWKNFVVNLVFEVNTNVCWRPNDKLVEPLLNQQHKSKQNLR